MGKINGSEAKIGIKKGVTHGTAVALTGANGMAFDTIEWSDNPEQLEFSSKGLGYSMKNYLKLGKLSPNVTLNYKLKFGGVGMALLQGFLGDDTTPAETNVGEGDYNRKIFYSNAVNFFTIAVQTTSATSIEWASCYPVSASITYESFQPVGISINFVTTPRNNTPATNTYSYIENNVTISDSADSWIVFNQASTFSTNTVGTGSLPSSHTYDVQTVTLNLTKNYEVTNEVTGTATTGAPNRTGLFTATLETQHAGLDDHSFMTLYENETALALVLSVAGDAIGLGANENFSLNIPSMKLVSDPSTGITQDGYNPVSLSWEGYIDSDNDGDYDEPYFYIINKSSSTY